MNLIERAKNILLSPKTEWPVIETETSSIRAIYLEYLLILAAIPAVAAFISTSLLGITVFGMTMRTPVVAGITGMAVSYALSLLMIYVVALIADALAPNFQGQKNQLNAFKLIAFSVTPGMLAGVLVILPSLSIIALLAALYGIYLLYLGAPVLMKVTQEKVIPYVVVLLLCTIVAGVLVGMVSSALTRSVTGGGAMHFGQAGMGGMGSPGMQAPAVLSIETPKGTVQIDTQKMEATNQQLEAIQKQAEDAEKRGDTAAQMQAAAQALSLMASSVSIQPAPGK